MHRPIDLLPDTPVRAFTVPLTGALAGFGDAAAFAIAGPESAPVVLVLGGISANRFPAVRPDGGAGWWPGVAGAGSALDPARWRILGMDFVSDPEGRRAPASADVAALIAAALDAAGIARVHAAVGASYGGMIAMRFAQDYPDRCARLVAISADARAHPASTAIRELQRRTVALGLAAGRGQEALSIARGMAMLTYRTREEFADRFEGGISGDDVLECTQPGTYLRARGDVYHQVMSPERFLSLSAAIDRHVAEPAKIAVPSLLIGATSDLLVPPSQMEALAGGIGANARLVLRHSAYGHDMFLKDADAISALIAPFLEESA
ncbi:alpha/beta fold hydrolase [Allosphingosinicella indica]|uniref:Homoserine O-acetyltransferase n=1 Tax=Allosphingosinicella indica TaxID=941907 RepID=A0A1X7G603_9SPHN|nr:alpha/beta fold hydrolase [Allosphingosinicella indica]SMF64030.1 homoserine O-acetyltransferase [Allosphingosinicella indica]